MSNVAAATSERSGSGVRASVVGRVALVQHVVNRLRSLWSSIKSWARRCVIVRW